MLDTVSILDGNEFLVSDRRGDIKATAELVHGLFLDDTRFLSRCVLSVNDTMPTVLSVDDLAYFKVQHFLALATGSTYVDSHLSISRQRSIGGGFREDLVIENHDNKPVPLAVRIELAADFADLFEVKDKVIVKKGALYSKVDGEGHLVLGYQRERFVRETHVTSSTPAQIDERGLLFHVRLAPQGRWSTCLEVLAVKDTANREHARSKIRRVSGGGPENERAADVRRWLTESPKLITSWQPLEHILRRSLIDLAALRFSKPIVPGALPAAGLPWFMTVFGRDSLITSFQALPFVPELAATTLRVLALLQARSEDPFRDAEPGKIPHELRFGELTAFEETPHSPYYGSADSTALFLILLEEYERWTGDRDLIRSLEREARAAMTWIERFGDRDGDGYIEFQRRNPKGLDNQCWKDSWDSIAFADGAIAVTPRATCELQGYSYDARIRTARLAREIWNDPTWATQLEQRAGELKRRFNIDFWIPERGFFALALDGNKRKVDSLTSNIGHLLWSGIADDDKARLCARHLLDNALFSGWGVRTMAEGEGSYNPIGYHVGTVWPHDNSIIAWGLRRYGYRDEAAQVALATLEAAALFNYRLPEAFAGYPRERTKYPVEYPTACSPQAWAAGAPLLLLRTLLGLESDGKHLIIEPALPDRIRRVELLDIPGVWGRTDAFGRARSGKRRRPRSTERSH
jgi:glycogen debranching enzyme